MSDDPHAPLASVRPVAVDLAAVVALTALALLAVFLPEVRESVLRAPLAVPLLVFLPGYALVAVLFPRGRPVTETGDNPDRTGITGAERVVLSVALSFAVVPSLGLVLAVTPPDLDTAWLTAGASAVTLACVVAASLRSSPGVTAGRTGLRDWSEHHLDTSPRDWPSAVCSLSGTDTRRDTALNAALVVVVVLAVALTGVTVFVADSGEAFTGLYLLSADGDRLDTRYPDELSTEESLSLVVGIDNEEGESVNYTVVVQLQAVAGPNTSTVQSRHEVASYTTPALDSGETWQRRHHIRPAATGQRVRLQYLLYHGPPPDEPTRENAALRTHLWLTVTDAE